MAYNSATEVMLVKFGDGGLVTISNADCGGKNIGLREYDYCQGGNTQTIKLLGSLPY